MRALLLVGNGLGLAQDSGYFQLESALDYAWNDQANVPLSDDDKNRIARCLNRSSITDAPKSEAELATLQRVIGACDYLNTVGDNTVHWLSDDARSFPDAVKQYFGRAAAYFHQYAGWLPEDFLDSVCAFIDQRNAHVAVLNYDNLLYHPFCVRDVCKGYDGNLVDGFHNAGFHRSNLERLFGRDFGWYMHLHGSPLFAESIPGTVIKLQENELEVNHHLKKHLILSHFTFKPGLIQHSEVLQAYWDYFQTALVESNYIVAFGYSGLDEHVNHVLRERVRSNVPVYIDVVEWDGAGAHPLRHQYWTQLFGKIDRLIQLPNILTHKFS